MKFSSNKCFIKYSGLEFHFCTSKLMYQWRNCGNLHWWLIQFFRDVLVLYFRPFWIYLYPHLSLSWSLICCFLPNDQAQANKVRSSSIVVETTHIIPVLYNILVLILSLKNLPSTLCNIAVFLFFSTDERPCLPIPMFLSHETKLV